MTPETLSITVTLQDIKQGKRCCSISCPIALAAQRAASAAGFNPRQLFVTPAMLLFRSTDADFYYPLPAAAQQFQGRFDRAEWDDIEPGLEPFTFEVLWDPGFPTKGNSHKGSRDILLPF